MKPLDATARKELRKRIERNPSRDKAVELAMTTNQSLREIGNAFGVSHETVRLWIAKDNEEHRTARAEEFELYRRRQRRVCEQLQAKFLPLATADTACFEVAAKAAVIVLKVQERLARLDGLDAAEKAQVSITTAPALTLEEIAARAQTVSPLLMARGRANPRNEGVKVN